MKKIVLGVSMLVLAGCNQQTPPGVQSADQAQSEYEEMAMAMQSGKSVRCLMANSEKSETIMYLMKDKKVRLNTMVGNDTQSGSMLMDGTYMYNWDNIKKEGTKFKIPTEQLEQQMEEQKQNVPDLSKEEERKEYEDQGYTIDCNVEDIADSEFVPPTDVTFTDMGAMMEKAQETQKMQQDSMSPEDRAKFEQMMQQYNQ